MEKIRKHILTITFLAPVADDQLVADATVSQLTNEMDTGGWIGVVTHDEFEAFESDDEVREELLSMGNDGTFFDVDPWNEDSEGV